MGRVVTSGSLDGVMASTVASNARDMDSISALGEIFPIFIIQITLHQDPVQDMHYIIGEPTLYVYVRSCMACMYVIVSINNLAIPGE